MIGGMSMKMKNFSELEKTKTRMQLREYVREVANFYANTNNGINKEYITNYYKITDSCYYKILECAVIWNVVNEATVNRMEEKTCYNAQLHSGSFRQTEEKYEKLRERRKAYKEFPFTKKEAKEITNLFIEEKISKEKLAEKYCTTKPKIDKAIYVAIAENWIKDDQYMKIKESSLKIDSSEKTLEFFNQLDNLRASTKESS